MEKLTKKLRNRGYTDRIVYEKELLRVPNASVTLQPESRFFVDAGFRVVHTFIFALSAPMYGIKGILSLDLVPYHNLAASAYASKFDIDIAHTTDEVVVSRQYGMRKISLAAFDADRYVLRKGFEDFPACPYGHRFRMLGYDTHTGEYVRLAPAILKLPSLKIETPKESICKR